MPGSLRPGINGEPGERWRNTSDRVQWQLIVQWHNSCARCIQYDHQVSAWWPIPLHIGCNCEQFPIDPGGLADPFVDYRAKILELPPSQQARVMGRANLALIESGKVQWTDIVQRSRILDFHEVVDRFKLSAGDLSRAGIPGPTIRRAFATLQGPHSAAVSQARDLLRQAVGAGATPAEVRASLAGELAPRFGIQPGHGGVSVVKPPPPPPKPPAAAVKPVAPPSRPKFGTSRARVVVEEPDRVAAAVRDVFGRDVSPARLATLAGAPDDALASITVSRYAESAIRVRFESPDVEVGSRVIRRDDRGRLEIHNSLFEGRGSGKGTGAMMLGRQVEAAHEEGVAVITTTAARGGGYNGYYTWPRYGYDAMIPDRLRSILPGELAGAVRVSDLMLSAEGRAWWRENGDGLDMEFDPSPESLGRKVLDAYLNAKGLP